MVHTLLTVFDKAGKKEVKKIKMTTTGDSGIVDLVIKNTSSTVLRNPKMIPIDEKIKVLEPKVFPSRLISEERFNVKLELNGDVSFSDSIKFTYDFTKVEVL